MAKVREFYKGKRKRRDLTVIPVIIVVALISAVIVLFYSMQKFAVITKEDVEIVMPFDEKTDTKLDDFGKEIKTFETVETTITFKTPDYSAIEATAGKNSGELRAIFVEANEVTKEKLEEYAGRLIDGNALVVEMKPRAGNLLWNCNAETAFAYALSGESARTIEVEAAITELKAKDIYLVAQISCCIDNLLASSSTTVTLKNSMGATYNNELGMWLDPYNVNVKNYIVEMVEELYDMGFDEVVLADVMQPALAEEETVMYTTALSTEQNSVYAVSSLAIYVADRLSNRNGLLSIYIDSAKSLVGNDPSTGQNAVLFFKLFDRVYYRTDKYAYSFNLSDVKGSVTIGKAKDRLIPVVENYLPDNTSWVYIDTEEDD